MCRQGAGNGVLNLQLYICVALPCERAEVFCRGPGAVFERIGRAPRLLVPGDATEAGRMAFGKVTESRLFSRFRAHYRCESRYRDPYSGNEKGSAGNAVGFLRRNPPRPGPRGGLAGRARREARDRLRPHQRRSEVYSLT